MKQSCIQALGLLFILLACRKDPPVLPDCIQSSIYKISVAAQAGTQVKEYSFQNQSVWVFDQQQEVVDGTLPVLDKNCDTLGWLGGIGNLHLINGADFSNATYIRTVYSK